MIREKDVPKQTIDEKRNFIMLNWDHQGDYEEGREQGKVFGLFKLNRMRVSLHVVICKALLKLPNHNLLYKKDLLAHLQPPTEWQSDNFTSVGSFVTITSLRL